MERNYKHAEAFAHMLYQSGSGKQISIWNSRDGVTPFIVMLDGEEYQHVDFRNDRLDVDYVPKAGDYVFKTVTREYLTLSLSAYIQRLKEDKDASNHDWVRDNILNRPEAWMEDEIAEQTLRGEPYLELIT